MVSYKSIDHFEMGLASREQILRFSGFQQENPHVYLQTCNRVEVYEGFGEIPETVSSHLFRVVSGLESAIRGESAIQGQVKNAYESARSKFVLSASLHSLFQTALRVGKRVRTESGIGTGAVSHGQATVELILQSGINLQNANFTLIGVNKLTEDTIRFLQNKGAKAIFVANRSYQKALPLAQKLGCDIVSFDNLTEVLSRTDVLISATSAPHLILRKDQFPEKKSLLAFDLAFPRDIEDSVSKMANVHLYNLEDIEKSVAQNLAIRENEVVLAEKIIAEELWKFNKQIKRRVLKN